MHFTFKLFSFLTLLWIASAQEDKVVFEPEVLVKMDSDYLIYAYPGVPQLVNGHVLASLNFMAYKELFKVTQKDCTTFSVESPSRKLEFSLGATSYSLTEKTTTVASTLQSEAAVSPFGFTPNITDTNFEFENYCDVLIPVEIFAQAFQLKTTWEEESKTLFIDSSDSYKQNDYYSTEELDERYYGFPEIPDLATQFRITNLQLNSEGKLSFTIRHIKDEPTEVGPLYYATRFTDGASSNASTPLHPSEEQLCSTVDMKLSCVIELDTLLGFPTGNESNEPTPIHYLWFGLREFAQ
jgi:hypothetical protein